MGWMRNASSLVAGTAWLMSRTGWLAGMGSGQEAERQAGDQDHQHAARESARQQMRDVVPRPRGEGRQTDREVDRQPDHDQLRRHDDEIPDMQGQQYSVEERPDRDMHGSQQAAGD